MSLPNEVYIVKFKRTGKVKFTFDIEQADLWGKQGHEVKAYRNQFVVTCYDGPDWFTWGAMAVAVVSIIFHFIR